VLGARGEKETFSSFLIFLNGGAQSLPCRLSVEYKEVAIFL